jgi:hypothetical protein
MLVKCLCASNLTVIMVTIGQYRKKKENNLQNVQIFRNDSINQNYIHEEK